MRARRRAARLIDHPLLNGLIALAVIFAAVYISYFAGNGVPFIKTYKLYAEVPDAGKLTAHADVRIGGARIGQVVAIEAMPARGSQRAYARLTLQIDGGVRPLPVDSSSEVRLASVLGGEYVGLTPGRSPTHLAQDATLPLAQAHPSVDVDDAFGAFGPPTRRSVRSLVGSLGDAVAGRGADINATIGDTNRLLGPLDRVLATLAAPSTGLGSFIAGTAAAMGALEPVAGTLGELIANGDLTFAALARVGGPLGQAIDALSPTELAGTAVLGRATPTLADAAALAQGLAPGAALLPEATTRLDEVVRASTPVAQQMPELAAPLSDAFSAVAAFSADPATSGAVRVLSKNDLPTVGGSALFGLAAILRTVSTAQLSCNAAVLWIRNLGAVATEGDAGGTWVRMLPILNLGQAFHSSTPASDLHVNFYPRENAGECQAGNEPYLPGQVIGNPPGPHPNTVEWTSAPASATHLAAQAGVISRQSERQR